jgi:Ca-activated chloride channel homolog
MDGILEDWLSPHWFYSETLSGFDWENPIFLYAIPFVPFSFVLRWLLYIRGGQKLNIALPEKQLRSDWVALLRFFPPLLLMVSIMLLLVAIARPQKTNEQVDQWTEGIDIMLVLDISESMQIEDFTPNRLEAAKKVARGFIEGRLQDRIGLVIFSGEAISYAPLTTDYSMLQSLINDITFQMIQKGGTAIGSAIAVGINRMRESTSKSKIMILLSDGENTAGSIDPVTAANLAYAYGVKIYSIGVGKEGKVPYGTDMFGRPRYVEQSLDETALREIARIGEGQFFRATDNKTLEQVFKRIDQYEKAEIKENRFKDTHDFYPIYLLYGMLFWLLWLLTKSTFMVNVLED